MKTVLLCAAILAAALPACAAIDCDSVVVDQARILDGTDVDRIKEASRILMDKGAEVHVVTALLGYAPDLDHAERTMEQVCPSWRSVDGHRKNTLIVFAVAPREHKSGIYYGSSWAGVLENDWNSIRAESMTQRFRQGDFTGGFIAAEERVGSLIAASRVGVLRDGDMDRPRHADEPDESPGIWKQFHLTVILIATLIFALLLIILSRRKKGDQSGSSYQQQSASPDQYRPTPQSNAPPQYTSQPVPYPVVVNTGSNNGFVEGLIVGDVLGSRAPEPQRYYEAPTTIVNNYSEPASSGNSDSSSESSWDSSGSGGGGSSDYGSSDSGGGGSSDH